ncbi:hypothetical protein ACYZUA_11150 [Pseudomonas sp. LS2P72]
MLAPLHVESKRFLPGIARVSPGYEGIWHFYYLEKNTVDNSDNLELQSALSLLKEQAEALAGLEGRATAAETLLVKARLELESSKSRAAKSERDLIAARLEIKSLQEALSAGADGSRVSTRGRRSRSLGVTIPQPSLSANTPTSHGGLLVKIRRKAGKAARGALVLVIRPVVRNPTLVATAKKVFRRFPNLYHNLRMFAFRRGLMSAAQSNPAGRFGRNGGIEDLPEGFMPGHTPLSPKAQNIYTDIKSRMSEQESR